MRGLPVILPVLDFTTIKNELFPVVAAVFSKTNSLAIKVRGLQAFVVLCGGSNDADDGLDGLTAEKKKASSSTALDKYTMQEKIVPLIKAIKTKEPAVMLAALAVLRVVGEFADAEFVAMEILPVLWNMSLGPLLNLKQFQSFMDLIKTLSRRVEDEQKKKLQELSSVTNGGGPASPNEDFMAFGGITGMAFESTNGAGEDDFESLVKGKASSHSRDVMDTSWDAQPQANRTASPPVQRSSTPQFSWSTPSPSIVAAPPAQPSFRTVTPDLGRFDALTPVSTQFSKPLQPSTSSGGGGMMHTATLNSAQQSTVGMGWGAPPPATATPAANPWAYPASPPQQPGGNFAFGGMTNSMSNMSMGTNQQPQRSASSFSLAPPPSGASSNSSTPSGFSLPRPPGGGQPQRQASFGGQPAAATAVRPNYGGELSQAVSMGSMNSMNGMMGSNGGMMIGGNKPGGGSQSVSQQKHGGSSGSTLDKYESLI